MCKCCCWWWSTSSLSWWWWWRWWRWRWWWLYFIIIDHYDDEEYDDWQPLFPRKPSHELWGKRWKKDSNTFRQLNKERFGTCLEELAGFEALPHIPLQMITVSADKCGQDYCNLRVKQKYQHIWCVTLWHQYIHVHAPLSPETSPVHMLPRRDHKRSYFSASKGQPVVELDLRRSKVILTCWTPQVPPTFWGYTSQQLIWVSGCCGPVLPNWHALSFLGDVERRGSLWHPLTSRSCPTILKQRPNRAEEHATS
jgi:hypothetical protein